MSNTRVEECPYKKVFLIDTGGKKLYSNKSIIFYEGDATIVIGSTIHAVAVNREGSTVNPSPTEDVINCGINLGRVTLIGTPAMIRNVDRPDWFEKTVAQAKVEMAEIIENEKPPE